MKILNSDNRLTAKVILGGGAALGLAEIGVLQVLEKHFEISGIVGTSMGSIVGGLYACGKSPEEILQIAQLTKKSRLFNPFNLDKTLSGIFDGKKILSLFEEWTDGRTIENAFLPYLAVSYDLTHLNTVIMNKGSLAKAMRASSSVPYIFAPFKWGKYLFVDGGVEFPLPLSMADLVPGDLTIAVNVLPVKMQDPELIELTTSKAGSKLRMHEIFLRSVTQNQAYLAMHAIVDYKPDIVVDAYYSQGSLFGFDEADTFYNWGMTQAEEALAHYEQPNYFDKIRRNYKALITKLNKGLPGKLYASQR